MVTSVLALLCTWPYAKNTINTLFLSCDINNVILAFKMKELRVKEFKYLTLSLISEFKHEN